MVKLTTFCPDVRAFMALEKKKVLKMQLFIENGDIVNYINHLWSLHCQYKVLPRCSQETRYQSSYHMKVPK